MFTGSFTEVVDRRGADVVLLGADGLPVFGFNPSRPGTAVQTNVASLATSQSLLADNAARRGFVIFNDSGKTLRVAFGVAASATVFTLLIPSKALYESPLDGYTGELFGIWEAANGAARVTELT